ncbi:MAG: hypothetical protein AB7V44_30485 [Pseudonocardia sp.]
MAGGSNASGLPAAVVDVAGALGVLDVAGRLDPRFFDHPLDTVAGCLTVAGRRRLLLSAIDELMARDPVFSQAGLPELRAYPLIDVAPHRLAIAVRLSGAADAVAVTVLLLGRVVVDDEAGVAVEIEVPLVHADGDTLTAVTATPAHPIRLEAQCRVGAGGDLAAVATVHAEGGAIGVRLTGMAVGDTVLPPLELRSDQLTGDVRSALEAVLTLVTTALGAFAGGGTPADVLAHLPGLLGFDAALPRA